MLKMLRIATLFGLLLTPAFAETNKGNITFNLKNADPVVFSHDFHTKTRGVKCAACHFGSFSDADRGYQMKKEKLTKRDFCEHCHNGMKSFDARAEKNCKRCHKK